MQKRADYYPTQAYQNAPFLENEKETTNWTLISPQCLLKLLDRMSGQFVRPDQRLPTEVSCENYLRKSLADKKDKNRETDKKCKREKEKEPETVILANGKAAYCAYVRNGAAEKVSYTAYFILHTGTQSKKFV